MQVLESDPDVMAALKANTARQHQEVERLMPFFDEHLSLGIYRETLVAFLGFYEPVEDELTSISGWQTVGLDPTRRLRANLLRTDLRALGLPESIFPSLPRCEDLPELDNCFDGLGCLYVLEGSTLGGQLIARELHRRLGIDQQSGAAFFHSYGADVGSMWKEFCAAVRESVDTPIKLQSAVTAAKRTFASFAA